MTTKTSYHSLDAESLARTQARYEKRGGYWCIRCPAHNGDDLNCGLKDTDKGVTTTCFSHGCSTENIKRALGIWREASEKRSAARLVATYQHPDGDAAPCLSLGLSTRF